MGYIIKVGTLIGENSGIVTKIEQDSVIVKQHFKDYMGRVNTREVILSLRKQEGVTGK
jgi:Tfp pilus assembly protein PilP